MHPIKWDVETPREMLEASTMAGTAGYAVFDRVSGLYKFMNLSSSVLPANQLELRRSAQKIHSLNKLWEHSIKLNTGKDYE